MIDINYSLRIAYTTALTGITGVPVFYQSVPNNITPDNYIVFRSITSSDVSGKTCSGTDTNVTVEIHTKNFVSNPGLNADTIAMDVFRRIYPYPGYTLPLDSAQMVRTDMVNDNTQDFTMNSGVQWISRFITFKHNIFHKHDLS